VSLGKAHSVKLKTAAFVKIVYSSVGVIHDFHRRVVQGRAVCATAALTQYVFIAK
jgi:hypothetical protein